MVLWFGCWILPERFMFWNIVPGVIALGGGKPSGLWLDCGYWIMEALTSWMDLCYLMRDWVLALTTSHWFSLEQVIIRGRWLSPGLSMHLLLCFCGLIVGSLMPPHTFKLPDTTYFINHLVSGISVGYIICRLKWWALGLAGGVVV